MTLYNLPSSNKVQRLQAAPTFHQVQLTRLLACGMPKINLPKELVDAIKDQILHTWTPALTSHEELVLNTLLELTIMRGRRDCVLELDSIWPVVNSVLSSGILNPFTDETYTDCPHENLEKAIRSMKARGLVNFTICQDGWICSINFLWSPEFEQVNEFVCSSSDDATRLN